MKNYIYVLHFLPRLQNKENWKEKDFLILQKHLDRLKRQKKRGTVKFSGSTDLPLDNKESFGIVAFESENEETAELFAQSDPAVMGKLMTAQCFPFKHAD